MRIRLAVLAIAVAATGTLAGCGDDAGTTTQETAGRRSPSAEPSTTPAATPSTARTPAPSRPAVATPESLRFTATTVDGKPFDGASLAGKPTVLWFWAAWCPKCRAAAPAYRAAAKRFGSRVNLVGVAGKSDQAAMRDFIADYDLAAITHLADDNDPLWTRFEITYQDQYVLIDQNGKVLHNRELSKQELTDRLAELAG